MLITRALLLAIAPPAFYFRVLRLRGLIRARERLVLATSETAGMTMLRHPLSLATSPHRARLLRRSNTVAPPLLLGGAAAARRAGGAAPPHRVGEAPPAPAAGVLPRQAAGDRGAQPQAPRRRRLTREDDEGDGWRPRRKMEKISTMPNGSGGGRALATWFVDRHAVEHIQTARASSGRASAVRLHSWRQFQGLVPLWKQPPPHPLVRRRAPGAARCLASSSRPMTLAASQPSTRASGCGRRRSAGTRLSSAPRRQPSRRRCSRCDACS